MSTNTAYAKTILDQIKAIDGFALMSWGVKDLLVIGKGVQFKTSGMVKNKVTVQVVLDEGKDLYVVKFYKVRKMVPNLIKEVSDVFVEDLVSTIDAVVG